MWLIKKKTESWFYFFRRLSTCTIFYTPLTSALNIYIPCSHTNIPKEKLNGISISPFEYFNRFDRCRLTLEWLLCRLHVLLQCISANLCKKCRSAYKIKTYMYLYNLYSLIWHTNNKLLDKLFFNTLSFKLKLKTFVCYFLWRKLNTIWVCTLWQSFLLY